MRLLITGGAGFVGSNLAARALAQGAELAVFDNLSRRGAVENLQWLRGQGPFALKVGDIRIAGDIEGFVADFRPDVIFHLAGQVAMTTSIANPRLDFETNALGSLNLLEAARKGAKAATILYSSTNKVYGDLEGLAYDELPTRYACPAFPRGFDETVRLCFQSPYGCSKGSADQYFLDYHRIHGLATAVFRHSSIYGSRQFATTDQGWVGWFCQKAIEAKAKPSAEPFTISGNGKQVRDLLNASDLADLYFSAAASPSKVVGQAFNVGGGLKNSMSLLELFAFLNAELGIEMRYRQLPPRASDQKVFVADIGKAACALAWAPRVDKEAGLREMVEWTRHGLGD